MGRRGHGPSNRIRVSDEMVSRLIDWGNEMSYHGALETEDEELLTKLEEIRDQRAASRGTIDDNERND
jgi:hypothetical protein